MCSPPRVGVAIWDHISHGLLAACRYRPRSRKHVRRNASRSSNLFKQMMAACDCPAVHEILPPHAPTLIIRHQFAHWSASGLGLRIGIATFCAQCGHFLRWLAMSRLTRNTSASAWRISMSGALRAINAKCKSHFSRSSPAMTIIFGQVARNTNDLLGALRNKNPSRCGLRRQCGGRVVNFFLMRGVRMPLSGVWLNSDSRS
jgi:hypothetical protein